MAAVSNLPDPVQPAPVQPAKLQATKLPLMKGKN
jgi:hypothetical protein